MILKAPFPYFGGKRSVAGKVWSALGDPKRYIEPFFGSGAVLLNRPKTSHEPVWEIVNDKDGFVANAWRSIQLSPDETAKWCDWPVNHADLMARRAELLRNEERLLDNLIADPTWHDPIIGGYWIWAASCWIASGLTASGAEPKLGKSNGVNAARCKVPRLTANSGVVHRLDIYQCFADLSARLRNVKVVCGDWSRVCGGSWQALSGQIRILCGMFFDPPYGVEDRDTSVYHHDGTTVAGDVMEWVRERGASPDFRIVLAGYEEYADLVENHGWWSDGWNARGGYANQGKGQGKENAKRETLYFSPHCIKQPKNATLF